MISNTVLTMGIGILPCVISISMVNGVLSNEVELSLPFDMWR